MSEDSEVKAISEFSNIFSSLLHTQKKNMEKPSFRDDPKYVGLVPTVRKHAPVRSTTDSKKDRTKWAHSVPARDIESEIHERDVLHESARCLKCADAPCSYSCPCRIDLGKFMYAVSKQDYYAGAKIMYADNPMALTCGYLCAASNLCRSSCNLNATHDSSIDIPYLQRFACDQFHRMNIGQIRDPSLPAVADLPTSYKDPIAIVGSGPASLSCAAYLSRLGYQKITLFEKDSFLGGIVVREIPEFRVPYAAVKADIDLCLSLGGVDVKLNTAVKSIEDLAKEYKGVFLGMGLPLAITLPFLKGIPTAREFLGDYAKATRDIVAPRAPIPKMSGRCLVLGGGDVAFDTAAAAIKCGADHVTMAFRENWPQIPANWEEIYVGLKEKLDFVSNAVPIDVKKTGDVITGIVFKMQSWDKAAGPYDDDATITMSFNHAVVAFGARVDRDAAKGLLGPVALNERGFITADPSTQQTNVDGIFAGGDNVQGSVSIVEATNDGKTAAWFMHKYIQKLAGVDVVADISLPRFYTEVDNVDISVDCMGLHFINPFGLSSASPVTSVGMIKRSFDAGYGFAVTKTMLLDKDVSTNVGPRIVRGGTQLTTGPNQGGFLNIEQLTEKTPMYWVEGIKSMKKEYPDRIIICSIMAQNVKEDWQAIARLGQESGADALELNVSCPHTGKKMMGHTAGQSTEAVRDITAWVKEVVTIPVITKMTPNVSDVSIMAEAAVEGGADAISAINTVSGIVQIRRDGTMWPSVGSNKRTAFGGVSGNIIRPVGLRACVSIRQRETTKDIPILGIGGVDGAESAVQFILAGAQVVQMTSSIQNQDYTIVDEMINGLKAHLYYAAREDLKDNVSQFMTAPTERGPLKLPYPTVLDECGKAVNSVTTVPNMDVNDQVVAVVNEDDCIKCGKCLMSCADTGYQAIIFDPVTHLPEITDKCMGCGLCGGVCPTMAITYEVKKIPHHPDRGYEKYDKSVKLPFDE